MILETRRHVREQYKSLTSKVKQMGERRDLKYFSCFPSKYFCGFGH